MKFFQAQPRIRLLIFDLDGTLIDSKTDLARSVNATLRHLGQPPLDDRTICSYVGQGAEALIARAVGDGVSREDIARGLQFFIHYYRQHKLDHTTLYPGVREALLRLVRGNGAERRVLAVLTNKPVFVSREIIEELDLGPLFRFVYGGNSFENKKPDPVGVLALLRDTGVSPAETMIVGDSDVDIVTGARAGVWTCGVTYGFGALELGSNPPDLMVNSLAELADALDGGASVPPSGSPPCPR